MNSADFDSVSDYAYLRLLVLRNDRATADLVEAMRSAGADPIVLKGAGTRELLDLPTRPSSDIDLLVSPHQRQVAERVLKGRGYRRTRGIHSDNWEHAEATAVDLHRSLARIGVSPAKCWAVLQGHTESLSLDGREVCVLDRPTRLVHLAIHATQDDTTRPGEDLQRALELVERHDWRAAAEVAAELKVSATVAWAIEQAGDCETAALFGRSRLAVNDTLERGWAEFFRSAAHWTERLRRTARLSENWVRWQAGRVVRLANGSSAFYRRSN